MKNLFVGVQADLRPIAPSLRKYLQAQKPWERCIVRAPMGLKLADARPLQFNDVLFENTSHLKDLSQVAGLTLFIGAPDLVYRSQWGVIAEVVDMWAFLGVGSLCFEAMTEWNSQFRFAYECCKIAGIDVMVEAVPSAHEVPAGCEILLQSQRYANHLRRGKLPKDYVYNVLVRKDALKFSGVFKGAFGKVPQTLNDLHGMLEATGANVFRYPGSITEENY